MRDGGQSRGNRTSGIVGLVIFLLVAVIMIVIMFLLRR
jgi:tetrahydromethanopterin S-methyltransferase subunit F